jgi:hypothetical protein
MFNVTGNFQLGAYNASYPNKVNGFQAMTMQQQQDADILIACFEEAIAAGLNPTQAQVQNQIFNACNIDPEDLDDFNLRRIEKKVQEIWESRNNGF